MSYRPICTSCSRTFSSKAYRPKDARCSPCRKRTYGPEFYDLSQQLKSEGSCYFCKTVERLAVHHKNRDRTDNRLSNLMVVCIQCHMSLHGKFGTFSEEHVQYVEKIIRGELGNRLVFKENL